MPITWHSRSELDLAKIDWTKADLTTEEQIAHQAKEDSDTAPVFTTDELLTPEEGQRWLEDSRGMFDETVRDPWE